MSQRHIVGGVLMVLLAAIHVASAGAANSPMADAAMKQNREAVRVAAASEGRRQRAAGRRHDGAALGRARWTISTRPIC